MLIDESLKNGQLIANRSVLRNLSEKEMETQQNQQFYSDVSNVLSGFGCATNIC